MKIFPSILAALLVLPMSPVLSSAVAADDRMQLLEELSNAHGPSGYESPVRAIMQREMKPLADRLETDGLGSLIGVLEVSPKAPNIMIAAHMDEVGMLVKRITDEGYVKYQVLGGVLPHAVINQRFRILTHKGYVTGIAGLKTIHVIPRGERDLKLDHREIFLDVGAAGKADAEQRLGIRPGDPIAADTEFEVLNGGQLYVGKAWDDRVGLAVMIEVMKQLRRSPAKANVYFAATAQEEIGMRGARTSSYLVHPDIGLSLEAGVAADYPGISLDEAQEVLGQGPGLFMFDVSMIPNQNLKQFVIATAERKKIPLQFNVQSGYGEDGAEMQKAFSGTPAVNLTVPTRYLHTHYSIIHRSDFDHMVDLVTALVRSLDAKTIAEIRQFP